MTISAVIGRPYYFPISSLTINDGAGSLSFTKKKNPLPRFLTLPGITPTGPHGNGSRWLGRREGNWDGFPGRFWTHWRMMSIRGSCVRLLMGAAVQRVVGNFLLKRKLVPSCRATPRVLGWWQRRGVTPLGRWHTSALPKRWVTGTLHWEGKSKPFYLTNLQQLNRICAESQRKLISSFSFVLSSRAVFHPVIPNK